MKRTHTPARRAAWLLLAAPALIAIPAYGQDAAPPPVTQTAPPAATAPAPAPEPQAAAPASTPTDAGASRTTIAPGAADVVDEARIAAQREAPARRATRAAPARSEARAAPARPAAPTRQAAPPPAAATAQPAPTTAPVAAAPAAVPAAVTEAPATAPEAATPPAETTETQTTTATSGFPVWPLLLVAGLILLGAIGYRMWSRRRDRQYVNYYDDAAPVETVYAEEPVVTPVAEERVAPVAPAYAAPTYVAPVAVAAAAAAPVEARETTTPLAQVEDASIADAGAEDVAALTDADAPVSDRPWLEFAMRPVRIGTSDDEAVVEIELTVANAGSVPARDVRVSAFMLADARGTDMEALLIDRPADAVIDPVTIAPGEGTRIDATLAALKTDVGSAHFRPVVVADARYRLPDGTEGRTSASFMVGVTHGDGIGPVELDETGMRDDVEARLHGEPLHA